MLQGRHPALVEQVSMASARTVYAGQSQRRKRLLQLSQCVCTVWGGRAGFPGTPLPHTDYPACLRAPTRCGSGPQGHHAGCAELSECVLSSRREAICLLLWAGVAPRGLGVSLLRDLSLQGAGLICAGLICGGLSTQGLSAAGGLMRRRSALTDVSPSPCLEGSRRRLTVP